VVFDAIALPLCDVRTAVRRRTDAGAQPDRAKSYALRLKELGPRLSGVPTVVFRSSVKYISSPGDTITWYRKKNFLAVNFIPASTVRDRRRHGQRASPLSMTNELGATALLRRGPPRPDTSPRLVLPPPSTPNPRVGCRSLHGLTFSL